MYHPKLQTSPPLPLVYPNAYHPIPAPPHKPYENNPDKGNQIPVLNQISTSVSWNSLFYHIDVLLAGKSFFISQQLCSAVVLVPRQVKHP